MQGNSSVLVRKDWRNVFEKCLCLNQAACDRKYSTEKKSSHYDVLGVTPKSTQADIKSAYYKMSMIYHPDKSTEENAKGKFRAITEAYEVLGNVRLKKLYDKGVLGRHRTQIDDEDEEKDPLSPQMRFYKSREKRHKAPVMRDGTTPIYDFDAWTRNHYQETFKFSQGERARKEMRIKIRHIRETRGKEEMSTWLIIFVCAIVTLSIFRPDYDVPQSVDEKK